MQTTSTSTSTSATPSWLLETDAPAVLADVPAGVEYHRVLAADDRRVVRGIVAIVLLFAGLVGSARLFLFLATLIDTELLGRTGFTPLQQAAGALSLGLLIPYCMLLQRAIYGVPFRSLHSVAGRFRFGVFGRALLVFAPLVLIAMSVLSMTGASEPIPWTTADLVAFFVIGMVLTPLAAAGEEYGFRGFMFRVVGGWSRRAGIGAVAGITTTTVVFSLVHGSLDPYILASYLVLFASLGIITWRTGGLEVAVALHGVYNLTALVLGTTLHVDLGGELSSRSDASGSIANLIPSAALVLVTAAAWWTTRRTGPARTPSAQN
ncbi:type II CAAX endopeptidase family protein [Curtobacterium sp. MCLR17_031]|uniref:CPBP family intramembrane glutamic endopeptidase n=1 Tax=Curtobacterium sp. MCLR17_031 TaxID=2175622 RepID=UPI000DA82D84|nr:type II CAAX endopeptidase family protein [Curtobacterium sp. MCLR17_031]WIE58132.1 type II CAAX endopeptidase family protein [Curtobacterium sp. MCLR17_031]